MRKASAKIVSEKHKLSLKNRNNTKKATNRHTQYIIGYFNQHISYVGITLL